LHRHSVGSDFSNVIIEPDITPLIEESQIQPPENARSVFEPPHPIENLSALLSGAGQSYSAPSEKTLLRPYIKHAQANTIAKKNGLLVPHWYTVFHHLTPPPPPPLPKKALPYLHPEILRLYSQPGSVDGILRCLLKVVEESAPNLRSIAEYYFQPLMYILLESV
jgi:hypothetical protein